MKRITLWVLSTLSTLVLLFGYSTSTSGPQATTPQSSIYSSSSGAASGTSGSSPGTSSSGTGSSGTTAPRTKTVTGAVAQTQWGPVQVRLKVSSQKITDVAVVQYPSGNGRDQEINSYALPILTKETIDAQSAGIDMVSGATVTSDGYVQSLQSAIDQAGL